MKSFDLPTPSHQAFVNITGQVAEAVRDSGVKDGVVVVFVPHTTAGVTINENADPDVPADIIDALERAIPWRANYAHGEGNAAAHVRASMMGSSCHILIENGRLQLGTWQGVFFAEFDGPRRREFWVQVLPSA